MTKTTMTTLTGNDAIQASHHLSNNMEMDVLSKPSQKSSLKRPRPESAKPEGAKRRSHEERLRLPPPVDEAQKKLQEAYRKACFDIGKHTHAPYIYCVLISGYCIYYNTLILMYHIINNCEYIIASFILFSYVIELF